MSVWVIPVPDGYSVEDAWMEIAVFGHLVDRKVSQDGVGGHWATIVVDDE